MSSTAPKPAVIEVNAAHFQTYKDPTVQGLEHIETLLSFSEAAKLERGNANVRPSSAHKTPTRAMRATVETDPASFHLRNRGITYIAEKASANPKTGKIKIVLPGVDPDAVSGPSQPRYGVADGGHTFSIVLETVEASESLKTQNEGWTEPYVRVHFVAGDVPALQEVVRGLNVSTQVQTYTLDEYGGAFEELKDALREGGFRADLVAYRENEERPWNVQEVLQRMACFLKDKWGSTQPTNMYKSRGKALQLWLDPDTRPEFRKLYHIIYEVLTLPEYIQSEYSRGTAAPEGRKLGKLKAVRLLPKVWQREGTDYLTDHKFDAAVLLPISAAFRELLETDTASGRYFWSIDPKRVFASAAQDLYALMATKLAKVKNSHHVGADVSYWSEAVNIVLRAKATVLAADTSRVV